MAVTGYCMKCKQKVDMQDPQPVVWKNGKDAVEGKCPNCGTKVAKVGKMA